MKRKLVSPRLLLAVAIFTLFESFVLAQDANQNQSPKGSFTGGAKLTTNSVWHGITQSRKNPSLQTRLGYAFGPVFEMGVAGSSVSYDDNKSNLLLSLQARVNIDFSNNYKMEIKFNDHHYYESGNRDGNTVGFVFLISDYKLIIEKDSNWQKTEAAANYLGVEKTFKISDWNWRNQLGYTMFSDQNLSNYFDLASFIGTPSGRVYWDFGFTWVNNASQFNGNADLMIIAELSVKF